MAQWLLYRSMEPGKLARFRPPTHMMDFFRRSEGIWFSQRTVHHFDLTADESGESNLIVTAIEQSDPRVESVCKAQGIDPSRAAGGGSFSWKDHLDDSEPNPNYAAVLIDVPDEDVGSAGIVSSGKLVRDRGYAENIPVVCRYFFGRDGILTIDTEYENNQGQERCWFLNENFRVRVTNTRLMGGVNLMAYCSERRYVTSDMLEGMVRANVERPRHHKMFDRL